MPSKEFPNEWNSDDNRRRRCRVDTVGEVKHPSQTPTIFIEAGKHNAPKKIHYRLLFSSNKDKCTLLNIYVTYTTKYAPKWQFYQINSVWNYPPNITNMRMPTRQKSSRIYGSTQYTITGVPVRPRRNIVFSRPPARSGTTSCCCVGLTMRDHGVISTQNFDVLKWIARHSSESSASS